MRRAVLILTALLLLFSVSGCARQEKTAEFFAMDTYMTIRAYGGGEAVSEAERLIFKLEKKLSVTDPESEMSRLNNMGEAELSDEAAELIGEALRLCGLTGGALDISVYPAVKAWGFTTGEHRVPKDGELSELLKVVDYRRIKLEGNFVRLGEGMLLDLGAVAKGYAGDTTAALLRDRGVGSALLNLGGNVQCLGGKPDGSAWKIGVQDPKGSGYIGVLECRDKAVVTSGGYERYFEEDGATYWHVIDVQTCGLRTYLGDSRRRVGTFLRRAQHGALRYGQREGRRALEGDGRLRGNIRLRKRGYIRYRGACGELCSVGGSHGQRGDTPR